MGVYKAIAFLAILAAAAVNGQMKITSVGNVDAKAQAELNVLMTEFKAKIATKAPTQAELDEFVKKLAALGFTVSGDLFTAESENGAILLQFEDSVEQLREKISTIDMQLKNIFKSLPADRADEIRVFQKKIHEEIARLAASLTAQKTLDKSGKAVTVTRQSIEASVAMVNGFITEINAILSKPLFSLETVNITITDAGRKYTTLLDGCSVIANNLISQIDLLLSLGDASKIYFAELTNLKTTLKQQLEALIIQFSSQLKTSGSAQIIINLGTRITNEVNTLIKSINVKLQKVQEKVVTSQKSNTKVVLILLQQRLAFLQMQLEQLKLSNNSAIISDLSSKVNVQLSVLEGYLKDLNLGKNVDVNIDLIINQISYISITIGDGPIVIAPPDDRIAGSLVLSTLQSLIYELQAEYNQLVSQYNTLIINNLIGQSTVIVDLEGQITERINKLKALLVTQKTILNLGQTITITEESYEEPVTTIRVLLKQMKAELEKIQTSVIEGQKNNTNAVVVMLKQRIEYFKLRIVFIHNLIEKLVTSKKIVDKSITLTITQITDLLEKELKLLDSYNGIKITFDVDVLITEQKKIEKQILDILERLIGIAIIPEKPAVDYSLVLEQFKTMILQIQRQEDQLLNQQQILVLKGKLAADVLGQLKTLEVDIKALIEKLQTRVKVQETSWKAGGQFTLTLDQMNVAIAEINGKMNAQSTLIVKLQDDLINVGSTNVQLVITIIEQRVSNLHVKLDFINQLKSKLLLLNVTLSADLLEQINKLSIEIEFQIGQLKKYHNDPNFKIDFNNLNKISIELEAKLVSLIKTIVEIRDKRVTSVGNDNAVLAALEVTVNQVLRDKERLSNIIKLAVVNGATEVQLDNIRKSYNSVTKAIESLQKVYEDQAKLVSVGKLITITSQTYANTVTVIQTQIQDAVDEAQALLALLAGQKADTKFIVVILQEKIASFESRLKIILDLKAKLSGSQDVAGIIDEGTKKLNDIISQIKALLELYNNGKGSEAQYNKLTVTINEVNARVLVILESLNSKLQLITNTPDNNIVLLKLKLTIENLKSELELLINQYKVFVVQQLVNSTQTTIAEKLQTTINSLILKLEVTYKEQSTLVVNGKTVTITDVSYALTVGEIRSHLKKFEQLLQQVQIGSEVDKSTLIVIVSQKIDYLNLQVKLIQDQIDRLSNSDNAVKAKLEQLVITINQLIKKLQAGGSNVEIKSILEQVVKVEISIKVVIEEARTVVVSNPNDSVVLFQLKMLIEQLTRQQEQLKGQLSVILVKLKDQNADVVAFRDNDNKIQKLLKELSDILAKQEGLTHVTLTLDSYQSIVVKINNLLATQANLINKLQGLLAQTASDKYLLIIVSQKISFLKLKLEKISALKSKVEGLKQSISSSLLAQIKEIKIAVSTQLSILEQQESNLKTGISVTINIEDILSNIDQLAKKLEDLIAKLEDLQNAGQNDKVQERLTELKFLISSMKRDYSGVVSQKEFLIVKKLVSSDALNKINTATDIAKDYLGKLEAILETQLLLSQNNKILTLESTVVAEHVEKFHAQIDIAEKIINDILAKYAATAKDNSAIIAIIDNVVRDYSVLIDAFNVFITKLAPHANVEKWRLASQICEVSIMKIQEIVKHLGDVKSSGNFDSVNVDKIFESKQSYLEIFLRNKKSFTDEFKDSVTPSGPTFDYNLLLTIFRRQFSQMESQYRLLVAQYNTTSQLYVNREAATNAYLNSFAQAVLNVTNSTDILIHISMIELKLNEQSDALKDFVDSIFNRFNGDLLIKVLLLKQRAANLNIKLEQIKLLVEILKKKSISVEFDQNIASIEVDVAHHVSAVEAINENKITIKQFLPLWDTELKLEADLADLIIKITYLINGKNGPDSGTNDDNLAIILVDYLRRREDKLVEVFQLISSNFKLDVVDLFNLLTVQANSVIGELEVQIKSAVTNDVRILLNKALGLISQQEDIIIRLNSQIVANPSTIIIKIFTFQLQYLQLELEQIIKLQLATNINLEDSIAQLKVQIQLLINAIEKLKVSLTNAPSVVITITPIFGGFGQIYINLTNIVSAPFVKSNPHVFLLQNLVESESLLVRIFYNIQLQFNIDSNSIREFYQLNYDIIKEIIKAYQANNENDIRASIQVIVEKIQRQEDIISAVNVSVLNMNPTKNIVFIVDLQIRYLELRLAYIIAANPGDNAQQNAELTTIRVEIENLRALLIELRLNFNLPALKIILSKINGGILSIRKFFLIIIQFILPTNVAQNPLLNLLNSLAAAENLLVKTFTDFQNNFRSWTTLNSRFQKLNQDIVRDITSAIEKSNGLSQPTEEVKKLIIKILDDMKEQEAILVEVNDAILRQNPSGSTAVLVIEDEVTYLMLKLKILLTFRSQVEADNVREIELLINALNELQALLKALKSNFNLSALTSIIQVINPLFTRLHRIFVIVIRFVFIPNYKTNPILLLLQAIGISENYILRVFSAGNLAVKATRNEILSFVALNEAVRKDYGLAGTNYFKNRAINQELNELIHALFKSIQEQEKIVDDIQGRVQGQEGDNVVAFLEQQLRYLKLHLDYILAVDTNDLGLGNEINSIIVAVADIEKILAQLRVSYNRTTLTLFLTRLNELKIRVRKVVVVVVKTYILPSQNSNPLAFYLRVVQTAENKLVSVFNEIKNAMYKINGAQAASFSNLCDVVLREIQLAIEQSSGQSDPSETVKQQILRIIKYMEQQEGLLAQFNLVIAEDSRNSAGIIGGEIEYLKLKLSILINFKDQAGENLAEINAIFAAIGELEQLLVALNRSFSVSGARTILLKINPLLIRLHRVYFIIIRIVLVPTYKTNPLLFILQAIGYSENQLLRIFTAAHDNVRATRDQILSFSALNLNVKKNYGLASLAVRRSRELNDEMKQLLTTLVYDILKQEAIIGDLHDKIQIGYSLQTTVVLLEQEIFYLKLHAGYLEAYAHESDSSILPEVKSILEAIGKLDKFIIYMKSNYSGNTLTPMKNAIRTVHHRIRNLIIRLKIFWFIQPQGLQELDLKFVEHQLRRARDALVVQVYSLELATNTPLQKAREHLDSLDVFIAKLTNNQAVESIKAALSQLHVSFLAISDKVLELMPKMGTDLAKLVTRNHVAILQNRLEEVRFRLAYDAANGQTSKFGEVSQQLSEMIRTLLAAVVSLERNESGAQDTIVRLLQKYHPQVDAGFRTLLELHVNYGINFVSNTGGNNEAIIDLRFYITDTRQQSLTLMTLIRAYTVSNQLDDRTSQKLIKLLVDSQTLVGKLETVVYSFYTAVWKSNSPPVVRTNDLIEAFAKIDNMLVEMITTLREVEQASRQRNPPFPIKNMETFFILSLRSQLENTRDRQLDTKKDFNRFDMTVVDKIQELITFLKLHVFFEHRQTLEQFNLNVIENMRDSVRFWSNKIGSCKSVDAKHGFYRVVLIHSQLALIDASTRTGPKIKPFEYPRLCDAINNKMVIFSDTSDDVRTRSRYGKCVA